MKISQAKTLSKLHESLIGRLKLKLFQEITGSCDKVPSLKQAIAYIKNFGSDYFPVLKFFTYLLTDGSYGILDSQKLKRNKDICSIWIALNKDPLTAPTLFQINGYLKNKEICAWVTCMKTEQNENLYNVIIYEEEHFPNKLLFYANIHASSNPKFPTIIFWDSDGRQLVVSEDETQFHNKPLFDLVIGLLEYISFHIYPGPIVNLSKASQLSKNKKQKSLFKGPVDRTLDKLIKETLLGKLPCVLAEVALQDIIPFSYDFCFKLPLDFIFETTKHASIIRERGMIVYWNGSHFVMNDDYTAYLALRLRNYENVNVVILGDAIPNHVKIIKRGGAELLPPIMVHPEKVFDLLDDQMKKMILDNYIDRVRSIGKAKSLMTARCLVLTEDKITEHIETIIEASNFDMEETFIMSYKDCTNLNSLDLNIKTIKSINERIVIIVHRDRDYLSDEDIEKIKRNITKTGAFPFITKGTDIESYYINKEHIHYLYPQIAEEKIDAMILSVTNSMQEIAVKNIHNYQSKKENISKSDLHLDSQNRYLSNVEKFRPGKKSYGHLKQLIQKEIKENPKLIVATEYIKDPVLEQYALKIWPDVY